MKLFTRLYQKLMDWAVHPHACWYLGIISFLESSCFPIPPDVMLIPMSMAKPERSIWYASLTTITSVLGGMAGYALGYLCFQFVQPWLIHLGYAAMYDNAVLWFKHWGFWAILISGCAPIPYKIFTIAAGALHFSFFPFVLASILGRGGRFYLIAFLMHNWGRQIESLFMRWMERLSWTFLVVMLVGIAAWHWRGII